LKVPLSICIHLNQTDEARLQGSTLVYEISCPSGYEFSYLELIELEKHVEGNARFRNLGSFVVATRKDSYDEVTIFLPMEKVNTIGEESCLKLNIFRYFEIGNLTEGYVKVYDYEKRFYEAENYFKLE
jgi:hypothetical protein